MLLLEREAQWERLRRAWHRCAAGGTAIVLVEGAAGCGTTALLRRLADHAAERGALVLHAEGPRDVTGPGQQPPAYGVLRRLLHASPAPDTAPENFATAVRALARHRPLLLCVDDLQDCDGPSLDHLTHLARSLHRVPVLLALGRAAGAGTAQAPAPDAEFLRHEAFDRIGVERLSPRATAVLAGRHHAGRGGDSDTAAPPLLAHRLYGLTGGNPLLCRALLLEQPEQPVAPQATGDEPRGTDGARAAGELRAAPGGPFLQAVTACLRRSGAPARRLTEALAVLGPHANAERAAEVTAGTAGAAAHVRDLLDAVGLTDGWRLRHPAVAAWALEAVAPGELTALGVRAARVLHAGGAGAGPTARRLLHAYHHPYATPTPAPASVSAPASASASAPAPAS
ncbi:AAA family ATPase, partial [Streptomyces sp. NPDC029674]|uniref:ATP-binding protein n=1 Tax=Streptomyces sp. NPDC029674 TaxID=3365297 RepID=UPI00384CE9F4